MNNESDRRMRKPKSQGKMEKWKNEKISEYQGRKELRKLQKIQIRGKNRNKNIKICTKKFGERKMSRTQIQI